MISDIDDTVLVTEATPLRQLLRRTLLEDAHERLPFPGAPALYQAFAARRAEPEGWIDGDARRACEAACAAADRGGGDDGPPTDASRARV